MISRLTKASLIAAAAGAAMQALASVPAEAFTLASPSPAPIVAGADVDHVFWHRWHYWHRPYYAHYGWHPHRWHCWFGPWGRRCGW